MKITFEISQSIQDLLEYCQSDKYSDFEMVHDENGVPYRNKARMVDLEFTNSYAEIIWKEQYMLIYTAWSQFTYEIEERDGKTYCTYNGAVKGFLKQALIPHITPAVDIHDCVCHSSTHGSMSFGDYLLARGLEYQWLLFM
jgi:hypothetical protein